MFCLDVFVFGQLVFLCIITKIRGNNASKRWKMKGLWEKSEVLDLFSQVEEFKNKNKTLREAFVAHAKKYNRQPNSVRNYYYHEVDELGKNQGRVKSLGIDLEKHQKSSISYFSRKEEVMLMQEISKLVEEGVSVRKACFILSKGDVSKMLRYQNKYRNFIGKGKKTLVVIDKNNDQNLLSSNIIEFRKKPKVLSEDEVQSLFMGLVRLVKRNSEKEGEEKYKAEIGKANNLLRKALSRISNQEREIEKLKEEYGKLKKEKERLQEKEKLLCCEKAERLAMSNIRD